MAINCQGYIAGKEYVMVFCKLIIGLENSMIFIIINYGCCDLILILIDKIR